MNEPDKKAVENTVRKNILVKKEIKVDDSQGYNSDEVDWQDSENKVVQFGIEVNDGGDERIDLLIWCQQLWKLVVTDTVDAEDRGGEVIDVAEVVVDAREVSEDSNIVNSEEAVIQEIVISQDMYQVNVIVARKEIWKVGENVSVLKKE